MSEAGIEEKLSTLIDDGDFARINARMARFNVFEAMGAVRSELRHSNFLAFLLSPTRAHGLGSEVLLRVLRAVLARMQADQRPVRPLELVVGDLDGAIVYRERDNMDLLIEIKALNLVVLFENKISAKAGDGQLAGYKKILDARYSKERRLLVFLTPDGTPPDEDGYVAFDYSDLATVLDDFIDQLNPDTALIIRHYTEMLRRHIVPDKELQDIARQLYQRHKEAFDFVFECRPTPEGLVELARNLLLGTSGLSEDRHAATMLRFVPQSWDNVSTLNTCPTNLWTRTGRAAVFEIKTGKGDANNLSERVNVALIIGPADAKIREALYNGARKIPALFKGLVKPMGNKYSTIYSRDFLTAAAAKDMGNEQKVKAITEAWNDFAQNELPALEQAMLEMAAAI
jgi:hypothetical protein